MAAPRILVTYGTNYGQTARIANRMDELLTERGFDVTIVQGDELPASTTPAEYEGVLVGASLVRGGYQRYVGDFVRRFGATLSGMPSAFFAVSGSAASVHPEERAEARKLAEAFCRSAGWRPTMIESMAGAIAYTRYGWLTRWIMKRISAKEGASTDTSRDHEYTDWAQVERFVAAFAEQVHPAPREPATTAPAPVPAA